MLVNWVKPLLLIGVIRDKNALNQEASQSSPEVLPDHTQEIHMDAYDSAWEQDDEPEKRRGDNSREGTAHRVAWAAVKTKYEKDENTGKWKGKGGS